MNDIDVRISGGASGRVRSGASVGEVLERLGAGRARQAVVARVDGREVDLACRLERRDQASAVVEIEPVTADTLAGLDVLRHSTAHLLAAAVLELFPGTKLGNGPAMLDDPRFGFFYDVIAPRLLTDADLPAIEARMRELVARGLPFRREELPKADVLRLFGDRDEPLKCELIEDKGGEVVSVYRIDGSAFVDFCLGPHVPSTDRLGAFTLVSLSGAYWKGDARRPQMQRIYGTAFATHGELDEWRHQREEAEKRDHRRLGRELDLFSIDERYGEGLILWHPRGGVVRKEMGGLPAAAAPGARLRPGPHAAHRQARPVAAQRARGALRRFDVLAAGLPRHRVPRQAHELSIPHRHLPVGAAVVPRPADQAGRAGDGLPR